MGMSVEVEMWAHCSLRHCILELQGSVRVLVLDQTHWRALADTGKIELTDPTWTVVAAAAAVAASEFAAVAAAAAVVIEAEHPLSEQVLD